MRTQVLACNMGIASMALVIIGLTNPALAFQQCESAFEKNDTGSGALANDQARGQMVTVKQVAVESQQALPVPSGYGINPHEIDRALKTPETNELTTHLLDAVDIFEQVAKLEHVLLQVFQPQYPHPKVDAAMQADPSSWRHFPDRFYQEHLATNAEDEKRVRSQYERAHRILSPHDIPDETLVLLAYASRKFEKVDSGLMRPTAIQNVMLQTIREFVAMRVNGKRLPIFNDFANATNRMFIEFAAANRAEKFLRKPELRQQRTFMSQNQYRDLLMGMLKKAPDLTLHEKVVLAQNLLEPELAAEENRLLDWIVTTGKNRKHDAKWMNVGVYFLSYLNTELEQHLNKSTSELIENGQTPHQAALKIQETATEYFLMLTDGQRTRVFEVLMEVFENISARKIKSLNIDDGRTHREMAIEFRALFDRVKKVVKEAERNERVEEARRLQEKLAANPIPTAVIRPKHPPEQAHQASVRRADRGTNNKPPSETSSEQTQVANSKEPNVVERPEGVALKDVKLEDIKVGERYWFVPFGAAKVGKGEAITSESAQYVVFSKAILEQLLEGRPQDLQMWVETFLVGPVPKKNANGLKILKRVKSKYKMYEIKTISKARLRVIVELNKTNRVWTWTWHAIVPHDEVDRYLKTHGYL